MTQQFEAPHPNGAVTLNKPPPTRHRRRLRQLLLVLLVVVGLAWGYAIWYSVSQRSPENLDDAARAAVAEACTTARNELAALPALDDATAANDVALVRDENAILIRMSDEIDAVRPDGSDPRAALDAWTEDWRALIRARAQFASDLEADGRARLSIPTVSEGGIKPITDRMDQYATQRGLDDCRPQALQAEVVDGPRDYEREAS